MGLLRSATRVASLGSVRAAGMALSKPAQFSPMLVTTRNFAQRSLPRLGHNLEDHFDMAEFVCRMHNPLGEYLLWAFIGCMGLVAFGPLLHSNYYFTGRFLPKDQGNTQLCDDSW